MPINEVVKESLILGICYPVIIKIFLKKKFFWPACVTDLDNNGPSLVSFSSVCQAKIFLGVLVHRF